MDSNDGQKITIKIAEREYVMKATSQESEETIRRAAAIINKKVAAFMANYPGKSMVDILSFVALNESINSISLQKKIDAIQKEAASLEKSTEVYLDNIGK